MSDVGISPLQTPVTVVTPVTLTSLVETLVILANDGTLSRYRFSLIFPFLIIFIYENTKELIKKNEKL